MKQPRLKEDKESLFETVSSNPFELWNQENKGINA
jgi:hypothetical protein